MKPMSMLIKQKKEYEDNNNNNNSLLSEGNIKRCKQYCTSENIPFYKYTSLNFIRLIHTHKHTRYIPKHSNKHTLHIRTHTNSIYTHSNKHTCMVWMNIPSITKTENI